jgi:hypothetical protein
MPAPISSATVAASPSTSATDGLQQTTSSSVASGTVSASKRSRNSPRRTSGAASRTSRTISGSKLCTMVRSSSPRSATMPMIRLTSSSEAGGLISSSRAGEGRSRTSSSNGTRVPAYAGENQEPASSARTSSTVRSQTCPLPSVVRSTVRSWITTGTPSAVVRTSNSTYVAPPRPAAARAGRVFSGATYE